MRVRVCYTVEVSDEFRRALRSYFGGSGLATRQEVRDWYEQRGEQGDDDMLSEYRGDAEDTEAYK